MTNFDKPANLAVSRRATLAGLAAGTALVSLPVRAHWPNSNPVFRHGVASGDPDATSVVLWTRITGEGEHKVRWQVAIEPSFDEILAQGEAETGPERDHTVKVLARSLPAGGTFYFRFIAGETISATARARTLPTGSLERLGIALASCSNFPFGFFNAYDAIAHDPGVDFVLHTGDYLYEYGHGEWGDDVAKTIGRQHEPAHEIVSLADYRTRHAQYKSDAGAQAMHGAHTLLACWDDHESANNPWTGGAQNHQPDKEGDWPARRDASIRAYYEWMPVREPEWLADGHSRMQFWRSYSFGDLATLDTIETRHTARAEQIDYLAWFPKLQSAEEVAAFRADVLGAAGRTMLAPELEASLDASWRRSVAAGQPWRLIGNPMPIAKTDVPDVVALGVIADPFADNAPFADEALQAAQALAWKGKWNLPFYPDTWDGYPWARERLYAMAREAGASDLIFLTGDSHSFWANRLADDEGRQIGLELGTSGITSPGDFMASGFDDETARALDNAFAEHVDEVVWTDNMHQGYVRLDLTHEAGLATFVAVDTVLDLNYRTLVVHRLAIRRRDDALEFS